METRRKSILCNPPDPTIKAQYRCASTAIFASNTAPNGDVRCWELLESSNFRHSRESGNLSAQRDSRLRGNDGFLDVAYWENKMIRQLNMLKSSSKPPIRAFDGRLRRGSSDFPAYASGSPPGVTLVVIRGDDEVPYFVACTAFNTGYATENTTFRNFCSSAAGAFETYSKSLLLIAKLCITKKLAGLCRSMR